VLSFRGAFEMSGAYTLAGTTLGPQESMARALNRTVDYLLQQGKEVWLILQVPELDFDVTECIGRPVTFEQHHRTPCAVPHDAVLRAQAPFRALVGDLQQRMPTLKVFDPLTALCDSEWCYGVRGGRVLYGDRQHLTSAGSLFFADKFRFR
jgi:SGNH domain-containing protein